MNMSISDNTGAKKNAPEMSMLTSYSMNSLLLTSKERCGTAKYGYTGCNVP